MAGLGIQIPIIFTAVANQALSSTNVLGKGLESVYTSLSEINSTFVKGKEFQKGYTEQFLSSQKSRIINWQTEANAIGQLSKAYFANEAAQSFNSDLLNITDTLKKVSSSLNRLNAGSETAPLININDLEKNITKLDEKTIGTVSNSINMLKESMEGLGDKTKNRSIEMLEDLNAVIAVGDADEINKQTKAIEFRGKVLNTMSKAKGFATQMAQIAKSAIGLTSFVRILSEVATAQNEVSRTAYEMGLAQEEAFGKAAVSIDKINKNVRNTADAMGDSALRAGTITKSSFTESAKAISQIARLRITKNIDEMEELTSISLDLGHALGLSSDSTAQFVKDLIVIGGVPVSMVRKAADALVTVQYNLGLTGEEATAVMSQVGKMMRQFQLFGGSAKQVDTVVKEVAKLSAVFTQAGLDASEAHQMLNDLLDPTKIEQNVMLWKGLGMSAAQGMQLMQGDGAQLENIAERQVDLARKLKAQYGGNVFALQAMAEAHGMSLATVQGLSAVQKKLTDQEKRDINLREAADAARQGMMDQLLMLWNSLSIIIHKAVFPAMRLLVPVISFIANLVSDIGVWLDGWTKKSNEFGGFLNGTMKVLSYISSILMTMFLFNLIKATKLMKYLKFLGGGLAKAFTGSLGMVKGVASFTKNLFSGLSAGKGLIGTLGGMIKKQVILGKIAQKAAAAKKAADAAELAMEAKKSAAALATKGTSTATNLTSGASGAAGAAGSTGTAASAFGTAATIAAVAVALLALGVAVWLVANGFATLATSMKDFDWTQMLAFAGVALAILIPLMWGMTVAVGALGAIGIGAAPGILAVGAAIFMMGAGIAIVVASFAILIYAITGLIKEMKTGGDAMTTMSSGMLTLALALGVIALAGYAAGPGLALLAISIAAIALTLFLANKTIERFSISMLNLGAGLKLISDFSEGALNNLTGLIDVLKTANFADNFLDQIGIISSALKNLEGESPILKLLTQSDVSGVEGKSAMNIDSSGIIGVIETGNKILATIATNTKLTYEALTSSKTNRSEGAGHSRELNLAKTVT